MFKITVTPEAREQLLNLPIAIRARVACILERLEQWPAVSGAKPLRHGLKGNFRIRTGDYRVLFAVNPAASTISVWKISDRKDVYED
jgi:mRNA interferase RelE/StbE